MSVFDKHRDALEHHETMMGTARGRLAVALDLLTDSLALVGQHGVYCRSERFPGQPKMDIALVLEQLDDAKQLVQSAMEELKHVQLSRGSESPPLRRLSRLRRSSAAGSRVSAPARQDHQPQRARDAEHLAERERQRSRRPAGAIELHSRSSSSRPTTSSVTSASSAAKTRPRKRSGTSICSSTVLNTHRIDPPKWAQSTQSAAIHSVGATASAM